MNNTVHEIHAQYQALKKTRSAIDAQLGEVATLLGGAKRTVFIGCGSSYSIAISGAALFNMHMNANATALPAGDILLRPEAYRKMLEGSVLVALSRSGETSEIIRAIQALRALSVSHELLAVSCAADSTLSKMGDVTVELPWAFDHSVCQTRTVTNLYFFCAYLTARLSGDSALADDLVRSVDGGENYMAEIEPVLKNIAEKPWNHAVVLGDAELSGLCGEGALAFKEICQLPSNDYRLLDVRHGPMVMIKEDTLIIAALSDADNDLERALLSDIVKKGATVIAYSDKPVSMPGVTSISFGAPLSHIARGIPVIAICQLVSYYKSALTGANPDAPDGLEAWIKL